MGWLDLPRVPEPEVMDDAGEVEAYSSSAAQMYLGKIDDTLVSHALKLVANMRAANVAGIALDIGTGPGQIAIKLASYLPGWLIIGVDRSPNMIRTALATRSAPPTSPRPGSKPAELEFLVADGNRLPFGDGIFDLVLCNSVLHHFEDPAG